MITREDVEQKMHELSEKYPKYETYIYSLRDDFIDMLGAQSESYFQFASGTANGEIHIINIILADDPGPAFEEITKTEYAMWGAIGHQHYNTEEGKE